METEKVIIVGLEMSEPIDASMDELEALVVAAGGEVVERVIQKRERKHPAHVIGKGKLEELSALVDFHEADTVILNDTLTGSQMRNLEETLSCKVVDRTGLILDIFAQRATSKEGMLQVKLAQLEYQLPRLVGYFDHLSRLGGGIGTRGPGEQKIDTDRRHIQREISQIKRHLAKAKTQRSTSRKQRQDQSVPIVSLVGYTNAGKSTILNGLLELSEDAVKGKHVFAKDMLFATLDTTHRKIAIKDHIPFLLSDTVGFVSKLPTELVEAFKGTLEDIQYSDLILHVIDSSQDNMELQMGITQEILSTLNIGDIPILTVYNKCDDNDAFARIHSGPSLGISALDSKDLMRLAQRIQSILQETYKSYVFQLPFHKMNVMNQLSKIYDLKDVSYEAEGVRFMCTMSPVDFQRYKAYRVHDV